MSIDRGDSHFDDAGTWEKACRHIGLYLAWAAERGLASDDHDAKDVAKSPTQHFIAMCDTKLWEDDFNEAGLAFTNAWYTSYLSEVSKYAKQRGVTDYEIPENAVTKQHFYAFLDDKLADAREKPAASAAKKKKPEKKPAKKPAAKKPAKKPAAKKPAKKR